MLLSDDRESSQAAVLDIESRRENAMIGMKYQDAFRHFVTRPSRICYVIHLPLTQPTISSSQDIKTKNFVSFHLTYLTHPNFPSRTPPPIPILPPLLRRPYTSLPHSVN